MFKLSCPGNHRIIVNQLLVSCHVILWDRWNIICKNATPATMFTRNGVLMSNEGGYDLLYFHYDLRIYGGIFNLNSGGVGVAVTARHFCNCLCLDRSESVEEVCSL